MTNSEKKPRKPKRTEELLVNPEDVAVEPAKPVKVERKKKVETAVITSGNSQMDYKEAVRFLRQKLRGFTKDHFQDFVNCWEDIKDPQKKAQMYLDAMKILMPAQSVIDIDIGTKEEDSFAMKLLILRDRAEKEKGGRT